MVLDTVFLIILVLFRWPSVPIATTADGRVAVPRLYRLALATGRQVASEGSSS
jgi:hypothetical protein